MSDDRPRNLHDGMDSRLLDRFSLREAPITNTTYRTVLSPKTEKFCGLLKPVLFVILWPTEGSGIGDTAKVLMQGSGEEVHVPLSHSLQQRVYELELRRIDGFWIGHRDEVLLVEEFSVGTEGN